MAIHRRHTTISRHLLHRERCLLSPPGHLHLTTHIVAIIGDRSSNSRTCILGQVSRFGTVRVHRSIQGSKSTIETMSLGNMGCKKIVGQDRDRGTSVEIIGTLIALEVTISMVGVGITATTSLHQIAHCFDNATRQVRSNCLA